MQSPTARYSLATIMTIAPFRVHAQCVEPVAVLTLLATAASSQGVGARSSESGSAPRTLPSPDSVTDGHGRIAWRSLGPTNQAGRVSVVVGVPGNRDVPSVARLPFPGCEQGSGLFLGCQRGP